MNNSGGNKGEFDSAIMKVLAVVLVIIAIFLVMGGCVAWLNMPAWHYLN